MKKINLIITLSLFIIVFSCNKEKITNLTSGNNKTTESQNNPEANVDIENLEYYAGVHNEILEYLGQQSDLAEISYEQKYDLIENFISSNYSGFNMPSSEDGDISVYLPRTLTDISDSLFNAEIISDLANSKFYDLEAIIFDYMYLSQIGSLIDTLQSFESDINNSENLTLYEKELIIGGSVITRYSTSFWANVLDSQSSYWYNIVVNQNIEESYVPSSYITLYLDVDDNPLDIKLSYKQLIDIAKFVEWSADCPGSWQPGACYQSVAINSGIASGY